MLVEVGEGDREEGVLRIRKGRGEGERTRESGKGVPPHVSCLRFSRAGAGGWAWGPAGREETILSS